MRLHPSLQSEQIGVIPPQGVVSFTSEVHNTLIHFTPGSHLIHVRGTQHIGSLYLSLKLRPNFGLKLWFKR